MSLADGLTEALRMARELEAQARALAAALEAQAREPTKPQCGAVSQSERCETWRAAERLGITRDHVRKLARRGCGVKVGGRWMVDITAARARLGGRHV